MFEVGFFEIVLILVLVLVVAGPERLPGIVRGIGHAAGRAKALAAQLKAEFDRELKSQELRELERAADEARRALETDVAKPAKPDDRA